MPRFSRDPLRKMISLRVTEEDERLLTDLAEQLGLPGGKADVLRTALDYWLEHAPEARQARKQVEGKDRQG
jgi:hypothetical protein